MKEHLRYRLAKLRFLPQQLLACTLFGIALFLASHLLERQDERQYARDAGGAIVTFAVTRWLSQQGRRRTDSRGNPLRTNTMKFWIPREHESEVPMSKDGDV